MKRTVILFALTLILGVAVGVISDQVFSAQHIKATMLLRTDLTGIEGKEGLLQLVEAAPGATFAKHYHPGEAFLYILDGSMTLHVEGKSPITLKQGDSYYLPFKKVHAGETTTDSLKLLVLRIHEKDQPIRILVK